jgi:hypothetical protein
LFSIRFFRLGLVRFCLFSYSPLAIQSSLLLGEIRSSIPQIYPNAIPAGRSRRGGLSMEGEGHCLSGCACVPRKSNPAPSQVCNKNHQIFHSCFVGADFSWMPSFGFVAWICCFKSGI